MRPERSWQIVRSYILTPLVVRSVPRRKLELLFFDLRVFSEDGHTTSSSATTSSQGGCEWRRSTSSGSLECGPWTSSQGEIESIFLLVSPRNILMVCFWAMKWPVFYLWNDSFGWSWFGDHKYLCFWAVKWPVFICGVTLSVGGRLRTTNILVPWNGQYFICGVTLSAGVLLKTTNVCFWAVKWPVFYLCNDSFGGVHLRTTNMLGREMASIFFVEWLFWRQFVWGPLIFVFLGREMASICSYLWNDSSGSLFGDCGWE